MLYCHNDTIELRMKQEALYLKIARILQEQIENSIYKEGERLPSIRSLQKEYAMSINTIKHAFLELESRSLIEARPKSGYFVSASYRSVLQMPSAGKYTNFEDNIPKDDLISKVFDTFQNKEVTRFSLGVPDKSFLPLAKLNKSTIKVLRKLDQGGTNYEPVQGSINLRRNVARWSRVMEGKLDQDDLVITSGAINAIYNCLLAVTQPGDAIAIESPVYFGLLQIAQLLGLRVIELPTHPVTGIEIEGLKKVLPKIKACCLTSNFSNPLGSLMPDEHKKEVVKMLTHHNIPLIEDDLYGNLYFGSTQPQPCKAFDEAGIVLWCGSVSKVLAPGYRVGWVTPGKFKQKIIRQKLLQTIATPSLYQEVVADFMEHGRFDHHLHTFRQKLFMNHQNFQRAIENYFPENTKISQPQGGFVLWLELEEKINTEHLYDTALKHNITFAPGRMFTQHEQYNNCLRLNYAMQWNERLENELKKLGHLVYMMSKQ